MPQGSRNFWEFRMDFISLISQKILSHTGIIVNSIQNNLIKDFAEKKAAALNCSPQEFAEKLTAFSDDFSEIIKLITINETYFFREEKQFDFLLKNIFPKFKEKTLSVWCAASSTGEEPYSILSLALENNIKISIFASDIDSQALSSLKQGVYTTNSFRNDGQKFHDLIKKYGIQNSQGLFVLNDDFKRELFSANYNLLSENPPEFSTRFDIIFLRNVFIYFNKDTRKKIIKKISHYLKDDGIIIFSMNEIGCINDEILPNTLEKAHSDQVYFLQKKSHDAKSLEPNAENQKSFQQKIQKKNSCVKIKTEQTFSEKNQILQEEKAKTPAFSKEDLKSLYEEISKFINHNKFDEAKKSVSKIEPERSLKHFSYFFQGYIEYYSDNKKQAEILFESSHILKSDFWPAFFYHGMVLKDIGNSQKASACFEKCLSLVKEKNLHDEYGFIFDSFSPAYIESICRNLS